MDLREAENRLRAIALSYPEAVEEFPWGESAFKVRGKTFLFLHHDADALSLTVKLPASRDFAGIFDFTKPTGHGLGKSGWITSRITQESDADLDLLIRWIDESWHAIAPKKLATVAALAD